MKPILTYGIKELKATKLTSFLIVIAIILSTMMTTAIGQSIGALKAMQIGQATHLNGNRHITFHNLKKEQVEKIYANEQDSFEMMNYWGGLGVFKVDDNALSLMLSEFQNNDNSVYENNMQIIEGKMPVNSNEIAIPKDAVQFFGRELSLGEKVSIPLRQSTKDGKYVVNFTADFVLVGILDTNYMDYYTGTLRGVVGSGAMEKMLPKNNQVYSVDIRFKDTNGFQKQIDRLVADYNIPDVQYNTVLLDMLGIAYDKKDLSDVNGFDLMLIMGVMVALLVLLASGLVIYNIMKISVTKKTRHFGTLRAIGLNRSSVYLLILFELSVLCVIGIPVGMLFGYLSAESILTGVTSFFTSELFLVNSQEELQALIKQHSTNPSVYLAISGAISVCFALIASLPSAKYAATISPVAAMNDIAVKIKRKNRNGKISKNFYRYFAKLNMKRNKARTAITIISLVMSIVVFLSLSAFTRSLDVSSSLQSEFDYSISNQAVGLSDDTLSEITNHNDIDTVFAQTYLLYTDMSKIPSPMPNMHDIKDIDLGFEVEATDFFELVGLNKSYLIDLAEKNIDEKQLQDLLSGKACIVRNPVDNELENDIGFRNYAAGDILKFGENELEVIYLLDNLGISGETGVVANSIQIIMIDTEFQEITGFTGYHNFKVKLTAEADKAELDTYIEDLANSQNGSYYLSYEKLNNQLKESAASIIFLAWGLILFIGLIGVLNIINTVYSNIHTRVNEIGISRAIGIDKNGIKKLFLWESCYYGIYASVIGVSVGYLFSLLISYSIYGKINIFPLSIIAIIAVVTISILACIIATLIPLKAIEKSDIISAITYME